MNSILNIEEEDRAEDLGSEEEVSVTELNAELQAAVNDGTAFVLRCSDSYDTRWCLWDGQTPDGRKRGAELGKEPFPWEGASDTRIRLADEIINDHALIMLASLMRSRMQAKPVESTDAREAAAYSTFLQWLFQNKMKRSARREGRLLGNWQELWGHAVLAVTWDQEVRIVKKPVTMEQMRNMALDAQAAGDPEGDRALDMLDAVADEEREEEVATWLRSLHALLSKSAARKQVRNLRLLGMMEVPKPQMVRNQPCWTACRPFRDIFYPANTCELESARWIAYREVLSPAELRSRILTQGYDEDEVNEACEKFAGNSVLQTVQYDQRQAKVSVIDEMKGMLEVICFYRRVTDEDGFVKIVATEFCPGCENALREEKTNYRCYPFVEFVRNRTERILIENKGVPELCDTQQIELKTGRDYRSDRSSITVLPPVEVPFQRPNIKLNFGPGSQVPVRKVGDVAFMSPPQTELDTAKLEEEVRTGVNDYFGRFDEKVNPARQALYSQQQVDDWLGAWAEVAHQTLALCREYMSNEEFARVTGVELPFASEGYLPPPGEYDIVIEFNAMDLNAEVVAMKLKAINEMVLPADTMGVVDRSVLIQWAMQAIDPTLANMVVRPQEAAANKEIEDEQVQFSKLFAGTEPEMKQGGENSALRLQVLNTILSRNPNVKRRYEGDEIFRKMMDARMQHFQFNLQQQQNAQIGRMGAMPALQEINAPQGGPLPTAGPPVGGPPMGARAPSARRAGPPMRAPAGGGAAPLGGRY
jgi:hypothetical protein